MDQQAFNSLYHETHALLYGYVFRLCGDPVLSEDIVQDAYLKYMEKPPREQHFKSQKSYLYTIATHKLTDHFRRQQKAKQTGIAMKNIAGHAEQPAIKEAPDPVIQDVLNSLAANDKMLLWLAYVEGCGHREIGDILKLKPGSIRVLLFRARQRFKDLLQQKTKK